MEIQFSVLDFFRDPLLLAPTLGTLSIAFTASQIGVLLLEKKETLLAEVLSHSAYPGILMIILFVGFFGPFSDGIVQLQVLLGAAVFSLFGLLFLQFIQKKLHFFEDVALCLTLSLFFGLGVLFASQIQFLFPALFVAVPFYLFGQAATLQESHIASLVPLSFFVLAVLFFFYKEWKIIIFDPLFAKVQGLPIQALSILFYALVILSLVVGMRACGVLLISALFIMPALSARRLTCRFGRLFFFSGAIALVGAFLGLFISVNFSSKGFSIPTGPMIVCVLTVITLLSVLFSPRTGVVKKGIEVLLFRFVSEKENLLKALWKKPSIPLAKSSIFGKKAASFFMQRALEREGYIIDRGGFYFLTDKGRIRAEKIIRLHRLWELYLVDWIGLNKERVHRSAEEIEHILTKELEGELSALLQDPRMDPHSQPIPRKMD